MKNYVTLIFNNQPIHYTESVFYDCFWGFPMLPYGTVEAEFDFLKNIAYFGADIGILGVFRERFSQQLSIPLLYFVSEVKSYPR